MKSSKSNLIPISLLFVIVGITFREYFLGVKSPSWDFLGAYLTNSIAWWRLGNFFDPPTYLPYAFSGYPAHALAQSSGWYLPYAILASFGQLSSYSIAILQVFTILFGLIGIYFFSKMFKFSNYVSLIISIGYFFTPGFFSNASQVDIVRAWAFAPWILIIVTPWKKYNVARIFFSSIFIFQFIISVYPGTLIASFYMVLIYLGCIFIFFKPELKSFTLFQISPFIFGVIMSLIKWLPLIAEDRISRGGNTVVVDEGIIATLIYPYETEVLANDLTMRSLFISPLVVMSMFLIRRFNSSVILFSLLAAFSIILGVDFKYNLDWQSILPLLDQSRFRTTDFKLYFTISILMLGGIGFTQALQKGLGLVRAGIAIAGAFVYLLVLNNLAKIAEMQEFILAAGNELARVAGISFVAIVSCLVAFAWLQSKIFSRLAILIYLIVMLFIGWKWVFQTPAVWHQDRLELEKFYYGAPIDELLRNSESNIPKYREERIGRDYPLPYPSELTFQIWNISELTNTFSSGGLVSLKGLSRYENLIDTAISEEGVSYHRLLKQRLTAWNVDALLINLETTRCMNDESCLLTPFEYTVTSWKPDRIDIKIFSNQAGLIVINEVPWRGWNAEVCYENICESSKVNSELDNKFVYVSVQSGAQSVTFRYIPPERTQAFAAFWIGFVSMIIVMAQVKRKFNLR